MKNWNFNENGYRIRKTSQKRFSQDITMLKKWFISAFPQNYLKKYEKLFNEKVYRIRKTSQKRFFAFLQDITMLRKWFISAFPEIEKISQTLTPKLCQKLYKNELLMKRCIGSAKPHRAVFRFFARYYDAEEVIHKRISWNWEDISNSGPKAMPKIIINWTFNEKVHRIRKTSQSRFSLFCKILRCWRSDSSAHFLKLRRYLKLWPQSYAKNYEKLNF